MKYRKIGKSDLQLSTITFGAWAAGGWMWGSTDRNEAIKAIQAGLEEGMTSIDTAPIYGQGTSEEIVGEAIKGFSRDKIQILTKFGMRWDTDQGDLVGPSKNNQGQDITIYKYAGKDSVIYECEQSLKRLGTDYIDLYQIHWNDKTTAIEETFEAVARLIEQGKIRYAGVCNYDKDQLARAASVCPIISDQIPYSMVNRGIEKETVPYCIANDIGILAYSPMERGLLTGKMKPGQQFGAGDHRANLPFFTDDSIARTNAFLKTIEPIADKYDVTLGQLVLGWTVAQPGITIALAGARNASQTISNARAGDLEIEQLDIDTITKELHTMLP
ncbi:aldo/keto reductase [Sphingobacterium spiritivorum]|uniref:aldo/keto reductase n=1 Tax=Sphingobacterium spiritivorum TaxID=258 RepID=UPI003DA49836